MVSCDFITEPIDVTLRVRMLPGEMATTQLSEIDIWREEGRDGKRRDAITLKTLSDVKTDVKQNKISEEFICNNRCKIKLFFSCFIVLVSCILWVIISWSTNNQTRHLLTLFAKFHKIHKIHFLCCFYNLLIVFSPFNAALVEKRLKLCI